MISILLLILILYSIWYKMIQDREKDDEKLIAILDQYIKLIELDKEIKSLRNEKG